VDLPHREAHTAAVVRAVRDAVLGPPPPGMIPRSDGTFAEPGATTPAGAA
jgi:hypothetical protein